MTKFEELAPLWNAKIEEDFDNIFKMCEREGRTLNMRAYKYCVLGEANGFADFYAFSSTDLQCEDCDYLSVKFMHVSDNANRLRNGEKKSFISQYRPIFRDEIPDTMTIEEIKADYVECKRRLEKHWDEKHAKNK